jgi:hypothetical protein
MDVHDLNPAVVQVPDNQASHRRGIGQECKEALFSQRALVAGLAWRVHIAAAIPSAVAVHVVIADTGLFLAQATGCALRLLGRYAT